MDVQMKHRLSRSGTYIQHRAVSPLDISLARYFGRRKMTSPDYLGIISLCFFQSRKVFLWNHQYMCGRLWVDVFKSEHIFVVINFLSGNLAAKNSAKKTIASWMGRHCCTSEKR